MTAPPVGRRPGVKPPRVTHRRSRVERRLDLRLLVPVLVAWPTVAFVALTISSALSWAGAGLAATASLSVLRWRPGERGRLVALTLACLAILLLAVAGHRTLRTIGPLDELGTQRAVVTVRASVAGEPRVVARVSSEERGPPVVVVHIDVHEVTGRGVMTAVGSPVLVIGGGDWAGLEWHDEIEAVLRLAPPELGDGVVAVARPKGPVRVVGSAGPVFEAAAFIRDRFRAATDHLPADARGLVPALVIGDTSRTPPDLTDAMLATGMSHLSAVSGSNVTLVLAAAVALCRMLAVRRRWRPWLAGACLAGFVVLARPEPSVIRAAVMGAVGLLALSASRRQAGIPALSGSIVVLLGWDPWLARSYGFALSAVATLGLLVFAQPWGRAIARVLPRRLAAVGPVIAVPVAAQAVCAPIVVPLQGTVSLVAVAANLLAAPLVAPTTIVGIAVALGSVGWVSGAGVIAWGAGIPALGIARVARACAEVPFGTVGWGDSAAAAVGLAVATAAVVLTAPWLWRHTRVRPVVVGSVVLGVTALAAPTAPLAWPPPGWVVVACDVGQGDGLVVNTGQGHAVVVDVGPDPGAMDGCLDRLGVAVLDLVVLTHFHSDHVDGLDGAFDGRQVRQIRVSPIADPEGEQQRVLGKAREAGVPVAELHAGDSVTLGSATARVWWPARRIDAGSVANNGSIVMTLHVNGVGVLLSGDIEREAAAEVVRAAARDPAAWAGIDVVKVAHHGSSNRDDRMLDGIAGGVALVSVGADNDYGHPAPSTLEALRSRGFDVHRTDLEGDLAVVATDSGIRVVGR